MRSVIYHRYGEPAEVLQVTEAPDLPVPAKGEVLIRATSRPVHPGDLIGVRGLYRAPGNVSPVGPDGARLGFEGAGVVDAVGADIDPASGLLPGKRVAFFPARWAWSDKVLASARFVTPIPDEIPEAVGAQLHVNPLTAAMLVRAVERTGISQGDVVILTAAASQVAKLAATILLRKGYAPIGVVRSGGSMASAQAESVDMSIVTTEEPGWLERIRGIANGRPLRILLDPVGGELASAIISRMEGGTVISYGDLSGQTINLPALAFSVRGITITGVSVGGWGNLPDDVRAADISTALELSRRDAGLFPIVGEYDLADVRQAVKHAERPGKRGAVLLTSRLNTTGEG